MSRWGPSVDGSLTTLGVVVAGVALLSVVALQSTGSTDAAVVTPAGGLVNNGPSGGSTTGGAPNAVGPTTGTGPRPGTTGTGGTRGTTGTTGLPGTTATSCAGSNGGSTDRGVTATSIKLGATVVQSGIGASFLGSVPIAMTAVKNEVNRTGGICGRRLDLKMVDDGWDPARGFQYIQNLIEGDKVFALAVNPSSEGLRLASGQGYLTKTRTPVVGTDGMLNSQYADPWIWPVAASTVSTMHIMAVDACNRLDKRQFSIVFDSKYHFGVEGAYAFNAAVKRCTGKDIPGYKDPRNGGNCTSRFCAISAGATSYETDNKTWNDQCFGGLGSDHCDFVALLLEPNEAKNFLRNGSQVTIDKGLAQTLFTRDFASRCGPICDQALVWTGYNPPIEEFAGLPAVKSYVTTVTGESPDVDVLNQFLEGGYAGMQMLVDALRRVGPNLTRDRLAALLDNNDYNAGLTTPLKWRKGNHFANASMQAFTIQYKNSFNGFRKTTGWVHDPYVGQDVN
jgi:ABC-type branched-subunit amino acid transport system substrate-binding protein